MMAASHFISGIASLLTIVVHLINLEKILFLARGYPHWHYILDFLSFTVTTGSFSFTRLFTHTFLLGFVIVGPLSIYQ